MNRDRNLSMLEGKTDWSVLIVGSGINGIGTFRDLALQGVDVLLIDKADFCSGASSASSHMVHGGIRYLENGEFRLVREAVQERNRLIENAPHLVKPLPTVIPIFKIFSGLLNAPLKFLGLLDKPSERGALVIKIGMTLYDFYTRAQKTVPSHKFLNRGSVVRKFPKISPDLKYAGIYYDGAMPSPERISVELIQDAEASLEAARAINYLSLVGIENRGTRVRLRDEVSGQEYLVQPKVLVNASGPWIDFTNASLGINSEFIGGTKGSHLVLDNPELRQEIGEYEFLFENQDGRIVLIYPLADKVMIGSTDIRVDSPNDVLCTEEEVDYFFRMIPHIFPNIELNRNQIIYRFSGVRPLPAAKSAFTGQISRDHKIELIEAGEDVAFPILSLVGGKWTSFRAFSEQTTDKVLSILGVERDVSTQILKIGGGAGYPKTEEEKQTLIDQFAENFSLDQELAGRLFDRYGTRLDLLAQKMKSYPHGMNESGVGDYLCGEIAFLTETESVVHLDDLFLRRSMIGKLGLLDSEGLVAIAEIVSDVLGWSDNRKRQEIERAIVLMKNSHGVDLA